MTKSPVRQLIRRVREHLLAGAKVKREAARTCPPAVAEAAQVLARSFRDGGKLLLCGNGGSAADCQHLAAEFVSRLRKEFVRPALPAVALTTDTSFLTGFANDCDFADIFARQVEALGKPGDVLLGLSTSGGSANVIRAIEAARRRGMKVITLTGRAGRLARMGDVCIKSPGRGTQHIQETHLAIAHVLCELTEELLYGK
jgi:D-sedoheptulose 7-phosphate isomerase